ncbi:MAG: hypothetical protein K0S78_494 [Thermomicrobiales bacterium]|jgi:hypothetical protein|nr:hypothetical protein [Thermomicrobiales bacterium]MDF3038369.1 hypothetical protein [Thermomicrobiales bacterium]
MGASNVEVESPEERELFAAMVERMRQLRRRAGVPDGVTAAEAVTLHMISAEELERARWGGPEPPAPTVAMREEPGGIS